MCNASSSVGILVKMGSSETERPDPRPLDTC